MLINRTLNTLICPKFFKLLQIYVGVSKQELMIKGIGVCILIGTQSYKQHGLAGLFLLLKRILEAVESLKKLQPKKYKK